MYKILFALLVIYSLVIIVSFHWFTPISVVSNTVTSESSNHSGNESGLSMVPSTGFSIPVPANQTEETSLKQTHTTVTSTNNDTGSEESRVVTVNRINLENAQEIQNFINDPSPLVRAAALERLLQIEEQHEIVEHVERQPGEVSKFLPIVLATFNTETDPFVLKRALDHLGEYGEKNSQAEQALVQLLQLPNLPENVLEQIGELFVENHGMSSKQAIQLVLGSPSAENIPDADMKNFGNTFTTNDSNDDLATP